ncbi:carbonic anhydrase [Undibacterium fentianense]|uniref:Carbonic anhydrase n=1 Tax=Undibacterium fentianense TaxID=2828728 RepID=A0A941E8M9_9BURK|nr:carbonic anhydrase family protein [Undibacterium fentianense]MBR7800663.1 carbonic anhydrase family protein [Undibacterium fentianense]
MKASLVFASLALASSMGMAADDHKWSYSGVGGPTEWAKLSEANGACAGKNQSPINLTGFIRANLKPIQFAYHTGGNEVINNGHTIQMNFMNGSHILVDHLQFDLKQVHFHSPSENQINGKSFPLEAHFVHADKDGNLSVVAVMFKEGAENKALAKIWALMPKEAEQKAALDMPLAGDQLLPKKRAYYRFNGSLTTPPCTEGVRWLVMKAPVSVSKEQVEAFSHIIHHPNNRPIQAVNARPVLQ